MTAQWQQRNGKRFIGSPVAFRYKEGATGRHRRLVTDEVDGETYELEWRTYSPGDTPNTGYHLYGGGYFGEFCARRLGEAVDEANQYIVHGPMRFLRDPE